MRMLKSAAMNFALFDTAIGACGIVWTARGICGVQLPEADAAATRARIARRYPAATEAVPPPEIASAPSTASSRCSAGEPRDLSDIAIDDADISDFNRKVYAIARAIPPGQTLTYGEIAERLGDKALARAVGQAMGENPTPIVMPCHRVLAANGKSGGFSGRAASSPNCACSPSKAPSRTARRLFDHLPLAAAPRRR